MCFLSIYKNLIKLIIECQSFWDNYTLILNFLLKKYVFSYVKLFQCKRMHY